MPRDLETICLKCLHKAAARRYAGARELAEDLCRYREGKPVRARRVGTAERAHKWAKRRPALAGLFASLAILVAGIAIGALLLYRQRVHRAETDGRVHEALTRAHSLLEQGSVANDNTKLTEARAEADRAVDVARSGGASLRVQQEAEALQGDAVARLRGQRSKAERSARGDGQKDLLAKHGTLL